MATLTYDLMRTTTVDNLVDLNNLSGDLADKEQVYCIDNKTMYIKDGSSIVALTSGTDSSIREFNTVLEMQASSFTVGDKIKLWGYHVLGEGAHERLVEASDDGSGISVGSGLFANLLYDDEIDVKWFGAIGDGIADDYDSINKCILYLNDADISAIMKFGNGSFRITKTLDFNLKQYVKGNKQYGTVGLCQILLDSDVPTIALMNIRHISNIDITSVQTKLHIGIATGGYITEYRHMVISNFDIGEKMSGVYCKHSKVVYTLCNTGISLHALNDSVNSSASTMFSFEDIAINYCDIGFTSKDTWLDNNDNYKEIPMTNHPSGLLNTTFTNVGFEKNRLGLTSESRLWDLTLINCWTEANTEAGIRLTDSSISTLINCRQNGGDVWDYKTISEYGNTCIISGGNIKYAKAMNNVFDNDYEVGSVVRVIIDVEKGIAVEGAELVDFINVESTNQIAVQLKKAMHQASMNISHIARNQFATNLYSLDNTFDAGAPATYGSFNKIYYQAYNPIDDTIIKPSFLIIDFRIFSQFTY